MRYRFTIVYSIVLICYYFNYCVATQWVCDMQDGSNGVKVLSCKPANGPTSNVTTTNTTVNVDGANTTEADAVNKCNNRTTENGTTCVCNSTYCDGIAKLPTLTKDQFVWYSSSNDGTYFNQQVGQLSGDNSTFIGDIFFINRTNVRQNFTGFGGAFTDAATMNIKSLSDDTAKQLLSCYFGSDGIGYTLGKVPIGSTDYGSRFYTYLDTPGSSISGFRLASEDRKYKIPVILQAKALTNDTLKLVGAAWTAPGWMKNSCNYLSKRNSLQEKYYELWAQYYSRFLVDYRQRGVLFWGITLGNEPLNQYYSPSILAANLSMMWQPNYQSKWLVNNLMPNLIKSRFTDVLIFAVDDNRKYATIYADWFFRDNSTGSDDCLECVRSTTYNYTAAFALHGYDEAETDASYLNELHSAYRDKFSLYTEYCSSSEFSTRLWDAAEDYTLKLIDALNRWSTGWLDFNLVLNKDFGPYNSTQCKCLAPIIVNATADEFEKLPAYYAIGHFSTFMRPDSKIVKIFPSCKGNVHATAAIRSDDGRLVIVAYNSNDFPKIVTFVADDGSTASLNMNGKTIYTIIFG